MEPVSQLISQSRKLKNIHKGENRILKNLVSIPVRALLVYIYDIYIYDYLYRICVRTPTGLPMAPHWDRMAGSRIE